MQRRNQLSSVYGSFNSVLTATILALAVPVFGGDIGVAMDDATDRAYVIDLESDSVLGTVDLASGWTGDCVVTPDESLAAAVIFDSGLWLIDLTQSPPVLAAGVNPIAISAVGQDVALTSDGRFAAVCGGADVVSIVDLSARSEVDTFDLGHSCQIVEICSDGSVLVGHSDLGLNSRLVRRLLLDDTGQLSDTGESFVPDFPTNITCAPGSNTAVVLQLGWDVTSTAIPILGAIDTITLAGAAATAVFPPDPDRVFVRAENAIEVWGYNSVTGVFAGAHSLEIPNTGTYVPLGGIDTLALDWSRRRLVDPSADTIKNYDISTGMSEAPISVTGALFTGVCVVSQEVVFADGFESGNAGRW